MTRGLLAVTLGGLLTLAHVTASAETIDARGASQCRTRGYSTDIDPAGTSVRSAPRTDAPVIGRLAPRTLLGPGTYEGVEFEVVGSKDGWLLIQKPDPESGLKLDAANAADGRAWISGTLVGVVLGNRSLRAAPRREAAVVADLSGPDRGPDSFAVSTVHGCDGKYLEVTGTWGGTLSRGWSLSPCSNQLTTCDSPSD